MNIDISESTVKTDGNEEKKDGDNKGKNKYLLVIENDWNNIIKSFPGALIRHRYGH